MPLTEGCGVTDLANWIMLIERSADSNFQVSGQFAVQNSNSNCPAQISGIAGVIGGSVPVNIQCNVAFPYTPAPGASLTCSFNIGPLATTPSGDIVISVTVGAGSPPVTLTIAGSSLVWVQTVVNGCVLLEQQGSTQTKICSSVPPSMVVNETITSDSSNTCITTAVQVSTLDGQLLVASAAIVICFCSASASAPAPPPPPPPSGCCHPRGYWKTHPSAWPSTHINQPFHGSGFLWTDVYLQSTSMCYWKLAQEYVTAQLNVEVAAQCMDVSLTAALVLADSTLNLYCLTPFALLCSTDVMGAFTTIANFNNGLGCAPACPS